MEAGTEQGSCHYQYAPHRWNSRDGVATWVWATPSAVRIPPQARYFYLPQNVQTGSLGPTQPPFHWKLEFFPAGKAAGGGGGEKLTAYLHPGPRSRMSRTMPLLMPPYREEDFAFAGHRSCACLQFHSVLKDTAANFELETATITHTNLP